jgi:hypothetical protein
MDKGKDVRKYGKVTRSLRWGKYVLHLGALFPIRTLAVVATVGGFLGAVLCALVTVLVLIAVFYGEVFYGEAMGIRFLFAGAVGLLLSIGIAYSGVKFLSMSLWGIKGTILRPLQPAENPILPDEELLVRASSMSAAQPAELLRAAAETTEEKPEELLRGAAHG